MGSLSSLRCILCLVHEKVFKIYIFLEQRVVKQKKKNIALAGNRTRAARVAGEHSTTEPPVLPWLPPI